jgi:Uma2 family endonuclease
VTSGYRLTSADLETFPDIKGVRYELIDGELYVSKQPQYGHQYACMKVGSALDVWSEESGLGVALATPGVVFAEDDDVIPDLVWISHARLLEALDDHGHFGSAPELVVEVLSPGPANELRDRQVKLDLYSRRDVQEYWLVDWQLRAVEVYRRDGERLVLVATLSDSDELTSPLLPGFRRSVVSLWAPQVTG